MRQWLKKSNKGIATKELQWLEVLDLVYKTGQLRVRVGDDDEKGRTYTLRKEDFRISNLSRRDVTDEIKYLLDRDDLVNVTHESNVLETPYEVTDARINLKTEGVRIAHERDQHQTQMTASTILAVATTGYLTVTAFQLLVDTGTSETLIQAGVSFCLARYYTIWPIPSILDSNSSSRLIWMFRNQHTKIN